MPYIHFTDEQKLRANSVDLVEFLRRQWETLLCLYGSRCRRVLSDILFPCEGVPECIGVEQESRIMILLSSPWPTDHSLLALLLCSFS